jgi:methyl-accepting chemotaxis protein
MRVIAKSGIGKDNIFAIRQLQFEARAKSATLMAETKQDIFVMRDKIDTIIKLIDQENQQGNQMTLQKTHSAMFSILVLIPLFALVIAMITYWLGRSIVRPLIKAVNVADAIAAGNLDNQIEVNSHSEYEVNQLLKAFSSMQTQLRQRIEQDRRVANEALRINSALDSVTTSVFIADNHHQIIYFNKSAEALLKKEEHHFRQRFNDFEVTQVLGATLDSYHRVPAHQRHLIENLSGSYSSKFKMGDLTIDSTVTPVINADGERLGTVAEFRDITAQVMVEQEINQVVAAASKGDFQPRIDLQNKTGFFHVFSEGLNQIIDYNQQAIKETMRMFSALAKGDLTQTMTNDYVGAFEQLKNDANATVRKLIEIMTVIKQTADSVSRVVEEISQGNVILNSRAEEQTKFLEQTGTNTEEITTTVQQNADNARYATELAINARERAQQGGEVVGQAIVAISEINDSSKRVADIIGVIDEIAFQTNLLALNAAVEAARAGEQGRGFAVVAAEVRNLAQRSAAAARDKSGKVLGEIVIAVKKVSDIIAEIAAASQEQSIGIQQINKTIVQMDQMTQQNASLIEESAIATRALAKQAQYLQRQVAFFDIGKTIDSSEI